MGIGDSIGVGGGAIVGGGEVGGIAVGATEVGGTRVGGRGVGGMAVGGTRVDVEAGGFVGTGVLIRPIPSDCVEVGVMVKVGFLVEVKVMVGVRVRVAVRLEEVVLADVAISPGKRSENWKPLVSLGVGTSPYNAVEVKPWWAKACQPITPNDKRNKATRATLALKEYFRMLKPLGILACFSACTFWSITWACSR